MVALRPSYIYDAQYLNVKQAVLTEVVWERCAEKRTWNLKQGSIQGIKQFCNQAD
jgi:hypothetical protein